MGDFENSLLRLKERLCVQSDKDTAQLLGMSDKALNARKKRGKFPIKEVFALAQQRPELRLDAEFIITGISAYTNTKTKLETRLVECYRICNAQQRAEIDNFVLKISDLLNLSGDEVTRRLAMYDTEIEMYR